MAFDTLVKSTVTSIKFTILLCRVLAPMCHVVVVTYTLLVFVDTTIPTEALWDLGTPFTFLGRLWWLITIMLVTSSMLLLGLILPPSLCRLRERQEEKQNRCSLIQPEHRLIQRQLTTGIDLKI